MQINLLKSWMLAGALAVLASPQHAEAQYALDYGFAFGTGNYLGDIGGDELTRRDFAADLHYGQTKFSSHVFVRYRLSPTFAVRGQLGTVYLEDYDNLSTNPARRTRNAHFRNYVNELSLRGEVNLFSLPMITRYTSKLRIGFNSYATLGVTGIVHNPEAQLDRNAADYLYETGQITLNPNQLDYDEWHNLREFGTEKVTYGSAALGFPLGVGVSFIVNYQFRVGMEFVWNLTLTDYLDDVSYTYADPTSLSDIGRILSSPSSLVVAEAAGVEDAVGYLDSFRWDEAYESPRGNPDKNDTYGTLQLTVSKVVMGSSNFRKNNFYNKRRTVKKRPSKPGSSRMGRGRAKF